jgi:outer membrane protein TolC
LAIAIVAAGCAPQPGLQEARDANAKQDMEVYRCRGPTIDGPLTLQDALDYAARHNIGAWIAAEESRFQQELATQSTLKLLPSLKLGSDYQDRSRFDASSSQSLETGGQSLEPSFSSEKRTASFDISVTWNLLDFGISFLRARQQSNRVTISIQRQRRVRQNLTWQVTRVYWRAIAAREVAERAEPINQAIAAMLEKTRQEIDDQTISQTEGLKRETSFLQRQDELRRYQREYLTAKMELSRLIGLPPGTPFTLARVDFNKPLEAAEYDAAELEWEALRQRPELFEKDLEQAISRDEAHIAISQMFPSPAMFWRLNYDSNRFLAFSHWNTVGLNASWDLLAIPHQIKQHDANTLQTGLIASRRMAIAVAILTQLHLSLIDYRQALEQYQFNGTIARKYDALLEAIESEVDEGKSHGGVRLDLQIKHLKAWAKYLTACSNLTIAGARVRNTVGRDHRLCSADSRESHSTGEPEVPIESALSSTPAARPVLAPRFKNVAQSTDPTPLPRFKENPPSPHPAAHETPGPARFSADATPPSSEGD